MALVFRNAFYEVDHVPGAPVARVRRSSLPFSSLDEITSAHAEAEAELRKLGATRLLIDVRDGPGGRNDPIFEEGGRLARQRMTRGFERIAILVRTAAGELHAARLSREDAIECGIFDREDAALSYLGG